MSEQQRVVTAVILCMGILLVWQFFFTPPAPQEEPAQRTDADIQPKGEEPVATPETAKAAARVVPQGEVPETHQELSTERFRAELTNRDAAVTRFELAHYDEAIWVRDGDKLKQDRSREQPVSLVTAEENGQPRQALVRLDIDNKPVSVPFAPIEGQPATFAGATDKGIAMRVQIVPDPQHYALAYTTHLENNGTSAQTVAPMMSLGLEQRGAEGGMFSPAPDQVHGLCTVGRSVERKALKDVKDETYNADGAAAWAGIDRQYFLIAVVPGTAAGGRCSIRAHDKTLWLDYAVAPAVLAPGASVDRTFTVYAGPKRDDEMNAVSPLLKEAVNYSLWGIPLGFLARPMVFLMNLFHGWTGSWGLAIICLTLLVKLLTFPVTYRSVVSMRRMQLLKPQLDKLKKQFDGDKERQQLEQMKLFREKGVNPIGGCLPMLLQMPIWVALYRMLWSSVDLYHQPFLWLRDLTHAETFPIMAICVGLLTFVQQRFQPSTMDQAQMKMMMYVMPVMFSVFMFALPSGLVLYMLVNSILTIGQQLAINRRQPAL